MGGDDIKPTDAKTSDNNIAASHYAGEIRIGKWKFNRVILSTHFNIFLYATCFWIQIGTLPVRLNSLFSLVIRDSSDFNPAFIF
jgi:hypothetical protein